jgi:hypothetical protein
VHAITLLPTILFVKTTRTVWKNFLSRARRGHARQLPRAPVGAVTDRTAARGAPRLRASRYEKLVVRYLATIRIAAINEWLPRPLWNTG